MASTTFQLLLIVMLETIMVLQLQLLKAILQTREMLLEHENMLAKIILEDRDREGC